MPDLSIGTATGGGPVTLLPAAASDGGIVFHSVKQDAEPIMSVFGHEPTALVGMIVGFLLVVGFLYAKFS